MSLSHEHVGSKIPAKINTYMLTRAELLIHLCYEIPCNSIWTWLICIELPRGTRVGNLEPVKNSDLIPWNQNETLSVKDTTPMGVGSEKKKNRHCFF